MADTNNHLVIMAGGVGSRFWPMSTEKTPKQFIDVLGAGRTLLQMTRDRFKGICPAENIWVVTNKRYAELVRQQLPDIPVGNILLEPCRRNTAPCIAYVSWRIKKQAPQANIVVTPSDHVVTDVIEFQRVVSQCLKFTKETDSIVTLGMKPSRPETGYGYIQADLSTNSLRNKEIFRVDQFREKPDLATAQRYVQENNFFWNAGIFIWRVETIVNALRMYAPRINRIFERLQDKMGTLEEQQVIDEVYPDCDNISIDYAVMEKAEEIFVCPADFGWSDLGTWGLCVCRANATCMAMRSSATISRCMRATTVWYTSRRDVRRLSKVSTATSWLSTTESCSFANCLRSSVSSSLANK